MNILRRRRLDRRTVLRGLAHGIGSAIALPTLDVMLNGNGTAYADGTAIPVRFGVWYWGSGVIRSRFFPKTTGANWEVTPELAPLAPLRSEIAVLGGYEIKDDGVVHHIGTAVMKTGRRYIKGGPAEFDTDAAVASFDVDVAKTLGAETRLRRLDVGVFSDGKFKGEGLNTRALSHNGPNSPNMAQTSPQAVFDQLFTSGPAPTGDAAAAKAARVHALGRTSVLDVVRQEAAGLRARVGAGDQRRIDEHLEGIRELEKRINATPPAASCAVPARPTVGAPNMQRPDMVKGNELMADLVAMALQCDLVRVFTFRHHGWTDDPVFWDLGGRDTHHNLTHNEPGDQPVVHKVNVFTMNALAVFLERLRRVTIGGQSLLNHTGIMAYSEVAEGRNHARNDIPLIMAGRAGGALKPGLYHRSTTRESATKANLTLMRAVGLKADSFGEGVNRVTDGIDAIL